MVSPILTFVYDRKKTATKTKSAVVELRITIDKQRKYISTGIKLFPKEWKDGCVVHRDDWKECNNQLQMIRRKVSDAITNMMEDGVFDINSIPSIVKSTTMVRITFLSYAKNLNKQREKEIRKSTARHYESVMNFLEEWKGIVSFSDINEAKITELDKELKNRGLKEVSRWNYHKLMKIFIKHAMRDGLLRRDPYTKLNIKKGKSDGLTRYLSPDEFHRFETCNIPIKKLEKIRDLFVFQTYTMLSYVDLANFDYSKCVKIDKQTVYISQRVKTNQKFTVVIVKKALDILKKYDYKLPIVSNVKYNDYLKNAVLCAGIDKPVTSHYARHTGATLLLNEGNVPLHIIQKMLGHASIKETERTYAKLLDETIVKTIANVQKNI